MKMLLFLAVMTLKWRERLQCIFFHSVVLLSFNKVTHRRVTSSIVGIVSKETGAASVGN